MELGQYLLSHYLQLLYRFFTGAERPHHKLVGPGLGVAVNRLDNLIGGAQAGAYKFVVRPLCSG